MDSTAQLEQAVKSGNLRGDELKSLREAASNISRDEIINSIRSGEFNEEDLSLIEASINSATHITMDPVFTQYRITLGDREYAADIHEHNLGFVYTLYKDNNVIKKGDVCSGATPDALRGIILNYEKEQKNG